ncbi:MAG: cfa, partial [Pseudomonas sp.]|nr:cfa [Pseudomonas sp.]
GGVGLLHTITNQREKSNDAWVDRHIFPGGYLPTVESIERHMARRGLWSIDRENLWQHYARTLSHWRANHQAHRDQIVAMFDEEFYRMRRRYARRQTLAPHPPPRFCDDCGSSPESD